MKTFLMCLLSVHFGLMSPWKHWLVDHDSIDSNSLAFLLRLICQVTMLLQNGSQWKEQQWIIWSSLLAQTGSTQSTWPRIESRQFWNISSERNSTPSLGNLLQYVGTCMKSSLIGSSCGSVSGHHLFSYCLESNMHPLKRAWASWHVPSDIYRNLGGTTQ